MNATAEIDKSGRLVIPKKLRDSLNLVPGTRVNLCQEDGRITIETDHQPGGLFLKSGLLVYDAGRVPPPDCVNWLDADREERLEKVGGQRPKP